MWFKELYSGFMAAQMIGYAANAIDILKLLAAETTELAMASSKSCVPDDSLEPRKVGIWVLACPPDQYSTEAQTMLDALSAWSQHQVQGNRVVSHVRMSALFGTDATFFMEQIASECTVNTPIDTCGIRILLRWHDGTKTRAVWRDIASHVSVLSGACAVRELQDTVVRISGEYDVQLPVVCMKPAADVVPPQAFYHTIRAVSTEFFNMLEGTASITLASHIKGNVKQLSPANVLVRVVDKRLGDSGLTHASCFHGAVLAMSEKRHEATEFAAQADKYGLRMPISADETAIGLHLCAVQAEGLQLGKFISLFGIIGIAGKPIHSPNSWVWVSRPAIRPIDAGLLTDFSLFPCSKESLLPGKSELESAFERFWLQTNNIYRLMGTGTPPMKPCTSTDSIDTQIVDDAIRSSSPKGVEALLKEDTIFMAGLQVDIKSERTTLGDAYAQIMSVAGETAISLNMKQAMASLGVRASLHDMFMHNQKALLAVREVDGAKRQHAEELASLALVYVDFAPGAKRARTINPQEALCLPPERMRRILKACALKGGDHLTLERGNPINTTRLQELVHSALWLGTRITGSVSGLATRSYNKLSDAKYANTPWLTMVEQAVAMSSSTSIVASQSTSTRLFFVVGTGKPEEIFIKTVELDGTVRGGSMDDMCRVKSPRVIILQRLDDTRTRLTATVKLE